MRSAMLSRARTTTVRATAQPGTKVEQWLKTPFDLAAFGPRVALGALVSLPERLQMIQTDVAKVQELLQSPAPIDEKQQMVLQEVEDTLVDFLQRGASVETDVLSAVKAALPQDLAARLDEVVPPIPGGDSAGGAGNGGSGGGAAGGWGVAAGAAAAAAAEAGAGVVYTADAVVDSQIASEMTEIRSAVAGVKAALEELRANTDASRGGMLRLNLREARDQLARRLREATLPAAAAGAVGGESAGSLAAARREAQVLLEEVDAQFFP